MGAWRPFPYRLAVAVLLVTLFAQLLAVNVHTSMTWDEGHHLFDGYTILEHRDFDLNPEVPPVAKAVAALPLLPMDLYEPAQQGRSSQLEAFVDGRDFLFKNDANRLLLLSRIAASCFALALVLLVFLSGKAMFGAATGLLASALLVFDPNLLAHGALVTTDVPITTLCFASIFAWHRYTSLPAVWSLCLCGLLTGLAFATKLTGLFLVPILVLLAVGESLWQRNARQLLSRAAALVGVFSIAYIILWACYGFRYAARPDSLALNPTLASYLKEYAQVGRPEPLELLARWHALPEAFLWGVANTRLTEERDLSYLFGALHRHGIWFYFPAAITIKSTLPFLFLLGLAGYVALRYRELRTRWLTLVVPVIIFLGFAMHSDMNIGVRHVLPVYPFLYLVGASALICLIHRDRRWLAAAVVLVVFQAITAARTFPAYVAYANEAWGGPQNVHRFLGDSNVDWGQQLKTAADYLAAHHVTDCWMAYTASGVVDESYYGVSCRPLPTAVNLWWIPVRMDVPPRIHGVVLISDIELKGLDLPFGQPNPYAQFRDLQPAAILDGGLFVFEGDFDMSLASHMVAVARR